MSAQPGISPGPRITAQSLSAMKQAQRPIVMVTAYDYPGARMVEDAGVDAVLVGDSLGMVVLGYDSTLPVTVDDMVHHTAAVSRGCKRALVVADMPFMSFTTSVSQALGNAGRLIAEGGAQAVKVEGAHPRVLRAVTAMVASGVPVMGHLGLTPQSVNVLGGYRTQARLAEQAAALLADCVALERAGAFAVVLECIPAELAMRASQILSIPTIGIGAGVGCDGQVQVFHDLLGMGDFVPRHAKRYADAGTLIRDAVSAYAREVRDGRFPEEAHSTHADADELARADILFTEGEEGA